jgi:hypothetical protein
MYHPGNAQYANVWPQCWDLQGPRGLEQKDLRNLNLGDLKKGLNGGVSPTPPKKLLNYGAAFSVSLFYRALFWDI